MSIKATEAQCHHGKLYLLALERTGWRRWVFGRWVHACEPFRRDIQRRCARVEAQLPEGETLGPEWEQGRREP